MDLRFAGLAPTAAEQAALDRLLGAPLQSWRGNGALGQRRHLLLPALHAVHDAVGWISRGAVDEIARRLDVAPADVYGVASFYARFSLEERPPRVLTEEEYTRLRAAALDHARDAAIIELVLQTGLMLSEVTRLKVNDLALPAIEPRRSVSTGHVRIAGIVAKAIERIGWAWSSR